MTGSMSVALAKIRAPNLPDLLALTGSTRGGIGNTVTIIIMLEGTGMRGRQKMQKDGNEDERILQVLQTWISIPLLVSFRQNLLGAVPVNRYREHLVRSLAVHHHGQKCPQHLPKAQVPTSLGLCLMIPATVKG